MTAIHGPGHNDHDLSFGEALDSANKDWHALSVTHRLTWTLDYHGLVVWWCSCHQSGPYNSAAADRHVLEAVQKVRGPIRPPKKR